MCFRTLFSVSQPLDLKWNSDSAARVSLDIFRFKYAYYLRWKIPYHPPFLIVYTLYLVNFVFFSVGLKSNVLLYLKYFCNVSL